MSAHGLVKSLVFFFFVWPFIILRYDEEKWRVIYLVQIKVVLGSRESVAFLLFRLEPFEQFVEDVVVTLLRRVSHDP